MGSCDKKLYAIHPNGTLKWNYRTGCCIRSSPAIDVDGTIYVGSCDRKLYAIHPNGTLKWSYTTGCGIVSSPAIDTDGTIYVGSNDGKLHAIYPDGTPKWSYTTCGRIKSSPAIDADGTIYVGSKDGHVYAINPNGTLLWKYDTGTMILYSSPAIAADGTVYIGNWDGNLYAFGPGTQPPGTPNRPPILDSVGDQTINETETVMIDLNASDPDGDPLTYSCNRTTDLFSDFDSSTGAGNWTTGYGDSGTYWVDFGVSDGEGGIANETIKITVSDANRAPVLDPVGNKTINETETVMIDLNASDQDGDTLTYSCNRTADLFTDFNSTTGTGNWTTDHNDYGTYWVDFGVSDGKGGTANETIRIDVLDANRPPVLEQVGDRTINENSLLEFTVSAIDLDGDTLTYSASNVPTGAAFDPDTQTFSWTPGFDQEGTYPDVHFEVSDGELTDSENITITVNNVSLSATIEVVAPHGCIGLGKQFDILINITPTMGVPLMGAQFDLNYNEDVISVLTLAVGDFLDPPVGISYSDIDNVAGVASFAATMTDTQNGVTNPGTFAIVHCMAVGQGATSQLNLTNALAYDNSTIPHEVTLDTLNDSVEVCANAPPVPVARFNFTYNNMADKVLSKAYFDGTDSTDDGSVTVYRWWFGDGQTGVGPTPEHAFNVRMYWEGVGVSGHYIQANVTLIVTDDGMPLMDNMAHIDVNVWIGGDANGDGRVNIGDAVMVGYYWGADCHTNADGLRWYDNPPADMADLNNDGCVNIGDTIPVGYCWGHTAW